MSEAQGALLDRTGWPAGPWDGEPDREEFVFADMDCLIRRAPMGALCGYVGVPEGHPWFGRHYNDIEASVHGGLTYAEPCAGSICHVAAPGRPLAVWWVGFDCGHLGVDYVPGFAALLISKKVSPDLYLEGQYRPIEYVREQTKGLALQARLAWRATASL